MGIASLDELQVFQEALEAERSVFVLITRSGLAADFNLRRQMAAASAAVSAQIAEGYGQLTDRHFAHYLAVARGSCNEMRAHIEIARARGYLSAAEADGVRQRYDHLGRRLTRLILYLRREYRRDRA